VRSVQSRDAGATLEQVEPQDLIRHGLISEFVGRLPVVGTWTSSIAARWSRSFRLDVLASKSEAAP